MQVGDQVLYVEDRESAPVAASVVGVYRGTNWVAIRCACGRVVDQVFASQSPHQSPHGGYCLKENR
jgi:hypothetical protein